MIDNLSLALTHGLMFLAAILLLRRQDLDREDGSAPRGLRRKRENEDAPDA